MNYLGHAAIACQVNREPRFVFGAMLPDLCEMARVGAPEVRDELIAQGVAHHKLVDALFHESVAFQALLTMARARLGAMGLRSGPRRAVAHVAIELVLDAYFSGRPSVVQSYLASLMATQAPGLRGALRWQDGTGLERLTRVCDLLLKRGQDAAPLSADLLAHRVIRTLSDRPRLALTAAECVALPAWLPPVAHAVERRAPDVEAELSEALGELRSR